MVESYKDFDRFNGPEDTLYVHSDYMITKEKNLILIDQNIYTDYLGLNTVIPTEIRFMLIQKQERGMTWMTCLRNIPVPGTF